MNSPLSFLASYTSPIMKGVIFMKITFDAKSILLGVVLGTMLTVYRASIAVAKDHIEKQEKA